MADILTWAQNQVGASGTHYQQTCGLGRSDAWCAAWITTGLIECGELGVTDGNKFTCASEYSGGSYSYQGYFRNLGQYYQVGSGYIPQPGDIVCWGKGTAATSNMGSHVGIVESVDPDGTIHTIEGNRGGKGAQGNTVGRYSYTPGTAAYANISGFAQPHYQQAPVGGGNYSAAGGNASGADEPGYTGGNALGVGVYNFKDYQVKDGDTIESIAAATGVSVELILSYNNLNRWDSLPATLKIPYLESAQANTVIEGTDNIERAHAISKKVYHPVIKAEFYTEGGALAVSTSETMDERVYGDKEMDFDIISCATQRSLSSDCSSMSITLTNRRDWYNILSSNDLVIVKMRRPEFGVDADLDEDEQEVFIGVIDDVRKSLDFSSGQPKRAIQVTARGMGKAFVNFNIGLIKNITANTAGGFVGDTAFNALCNVNSAKAIDIIWNTYVGKVIKYTFYNGKTLEDCVAYDSTDHPFESLKDFRCYSQYSGSLWNFIKELSNAPFNETFWEIKNGREVLTHRHTPFDPENWKGLKRRIIRDDDVVTDATGRSDLETYTVFMVNLKYLTSDISNYYNPLWYKPYYDKYGIAQLEVTSTYDVEYGNDEDAMRLYTEEVFNWNIKNNVFANGQIVVKGRASYKIGEIVVMESTGLEFYVEGVSHNFTVYGGWTTTLSVTRGILPSERFTPPWGMGQEMTSSAMEAIVNLANGDEIDWTGIQMTGPFTVAGGSGSTGGIGSDSGNVWSGSYLTPGTTIQVPAGKGTYSSHMGWSTITSKSSLQYKLREEAGKQQNGVLYDSQGLGKIDGRYVVAVTPKFGQIGDYITITYANGQKIEAIIGDFKGADATSEWGHAGGKDVVEFIVNKESGTWSGYGGSLTPSKVFTWMKGTEVSAITNTGNYWDAHKLQHP